ncbi:MAG: hypothetical protein DCE90_13285 [Pseudanabaena sp.]|nr:MAG: hypothetical protein DCE90_13285 [Pseudanabaena sp.]
MNTIKILTMEECKYIHATVLELRYLWEQQETAIPFYTLGAASYIDAKKHKIKYLDKVYTYNPILFNHFNWLYQKLGEQLTKYLQAPIAYPRHLALPGFHIFQSSKLFEQAIASIHYDLQYELIDWQDSSDFTNPLSFTLAIALPTYGGGLNMWKINYSETGKNPSLIKESSSARSPNFYPYELGSLVIHSGHILHQIAPCIDIQPNDERITLQGHAILNNGTWQLYW